MLIEALQNTVLINKRFQKQNKILVKIGHTPQKGIGTFVHFPIKVLIFLLKGFASNHPCCAKIESFALEGSFVLLSQKPNWHLAQFLRQEDLRRCKG